MGRGLKAAGGTADSEEDAAGAGATLGACRSWRGHDGPTPGQEWKGEMRTTDDEPRRLRRRAAVGLLAVGALAMAACSGAGTELATGDDNDGTAVVDNETDPAALASAIDGLDVTTTTEEAPQDGPDADASHEENCAQFEYREDAQAVLEQDLADPYNLDDDKNSVACEMLPIRPVQSLPPQTTAAPTTSPPQTLPAPDHAPDGPASPKQSDTAVRHFSVRRRQRPDQRHQSEDRQVTYS